MITNKIKSALTLVLYLFCVSCATVQETREPTNVLLSTDKKTHTLLEEIKQALEAQKYTVKTIDTSLGLLSTEPRAFNFEANKGQQRAQQSIQIRQEGASLKVKVIYKCSKNNVVFNDCLKDEPQLSEKIQRLDAKLLALIKELI